MSQSKAFHAASFSELAVGSNRLGNQLGEFGGNVAS
jgi:hypothetical protein